MKVSVEEAVLRAAITLIAERIDGLQEAYDQENCVGHIGNAAEIYDELTEAIATHDALLEAVERREGLWHRGPSAPLGAIRKHAGRRLVNKKREGR